MNIKTLGSLAVAALLLTACSNEEWLSTGTTDGVLTASVEGSYSSTRAGFDYPGGNFYWSNVDYIGVTSTGNANGFTSLKLKDGGGTASATFEGDIVGSLGDYAVYPIKDNKGQSYGHKIEGNNLVYNFPTEYEYTKVDADFVTATQGEGNSFNPAMFGIIKDDNVKLYHLGGVICIKISEMPVAEGTLTLTASKQITGGFSVSISDDLESYPMECTAKEISTTGADSQSGSSNNTVTITFSGASTTSSGVFYVPVPVGTYSLNIKVVGEGKSDPAINVAAGTYTINRCDLKKIELNKVSVGATASNLDNLETDLKNNDNVSVPDEIPPTGKTISIPAVDNGTETSPKSLSLQNVASGANITVTDAKIDNSESEGNSVKNFTLAIPNNESANVEDLLDVTITMPNTTVTLAGNGGSARYGEVTASTADNTLIIGSDVEVAKVVVNKGNVLVKKGAKLTAIEKASSLTSVKIICEEGATIPTNPGDGFVIENVDAAEVELRNVATNGGTFQLKNEMVLSSPLVVEKDMTLNLNGYALKANKDSFTDATGLGGSRQGVVLVRRGGHLTVSGDGSIDYNGNEGVYSAIVLTNKADETDVNLKGQPAKLTVNGGHLKGFYYGICGQGTRHDTEITINGGIVESQYTGVFHPQDGTMTVTGGEIKGVSAAVELRSGTINVSGGKLVATATEFSEKSNGSGTTMSGVALAVSQHSTDKDIAVNISGGEFNGVKALYEKDLQNENSSNITLAVENGTFNGGVYSENCPTFVTGGTFSDFSVVDYLADNANVTVNLVKDIELTNGLGITLNKDANVTVKLNGKTIKNSTETNETTPTSQVFCVEKGTLTIEGEGNVQSIAAEDSETDGYRMVVAAVGDGTVYIKGGNYYNEQKVNAQLDLIYARNNGKIYISGGKFESANYGTPQEGFDYGRYWVLNKENGTKGTSTISVSGGTFINFNPGNPNMDDDGSYLAEGYAAYLDNGVVATEAYGNPADGDKTYVVKSTTTTN